MGKSRIRKRLGIRVQSYKTVRQRTEIMKNFFSKLFRFGWEKHDPIETYLANSTDLADLENRQKQLVYGTVNPNLKGWI